MMSLKGGCHCQAIRFEVKIKDNPYLTHCNCSICKKTGFIHLIVPKANFTLVSGEAELNCYQFNQKIAKHYFCSCCGIKSFYIPRSNPDGVSVNARCLDDDIWQQWPIDKFDGDNWEDNSKKLSHLSKN